MKQANYQRIAKTYDNNEIRQQVPKDTLLERILAENALVSLRILDLGCGTGIYIKAQQDSFKEAVIEWFGCDLSEEMLTHAKKKAPFASLTQGFAESLPYEDAFFDVVVSNFAFHHFQDKTQAIQEIHRVLKDGGWIKIWNIAPHENPRWWLYSYFPDCYTIDRERFWHHEKLFQELESLGFAVTCKVTKTLSRVAIDFIYRQAKPRDISQLDVLDDAAFQQGLQKIQQDMQNQVPPIMNEDALTEIIGQKYD